MVIDLDRPAPPLAPRPPRRPSRAVLSAVTLLLTGAVIGGAAGYRVSEQRAGDARRSVVSLVILPDADEHPEDAVNPLRGPGQLANSVVLTRHVNLINAGPAPVRLTGFRIDRTGLQLLGQYLPTTDPVIPPAGRVLAIVHATVRCHTDPLTEPAPVIVDLVTADGVRRQPTISFDGRAWAGPVDAACL